MASWQLPTVSSHRVGPASPPRNASPSPGQLRWGLPKQGAPRPAPDSRASPRRPPDESLQKKRRDRFASSATLQLAHSSSLHQMEEDLPMMAQAVWLDDSTVQLEATTQFRKLLSIMTNVNDDKESMEISGTLGYVAHEYLLDGKLTEKSDIFAFGLCFLSC